MYNPKYPSPIDGRLLSPQQYLTEIACKRKAEKEGTKLPSGFWQLFEWKKFYSLQMIAANSLLKIYSIEIIINALNSKECSWMYSLSMKSLRENCEKQKIIADRQKELKQQQPKQEIVTKDTNIKPKDSVQKNNIRSKLDD